MEEGDTVVLKEVHHNHNQDIKKHLEDVGEITTVHGTTGKCLVEFDGVFERYWISPKWLERFDS